MRLPKYLNCEEAEGFRKALSSSLNGERRPTPDTIRAFLKAVDDAAERDESWAIKYRAESVRRCAQSDLKALAKAESLVMVSYKNTLLTKPSLVGVRTPQGQQQVLFAALTWDQCEDNARYEDLSAEARKANAATYRKLLELRDRASDTATVGEACQALGINLDEYLSESA